MRNKKTITKQAEMKRKSAQQKEGETGRKVVTTKVIVYHNCSKPRKKNDIILQALPIPHNPVIRMIPA